MERLISEGKTKTAGRPKGSFSVNFDRLEFKKMVIHEFPRLKTLAKKFNLNLNSAQYHRAQIFQELGIDATWYNQVANKKDPLPHPNKLIITAENAESKEFYQRNIILTFWNYDKNRWDVHTGLKELAKLRQCSVKRVKKEIEFHKLSSFITTPYATSIPAGLNLKNSNRRYYKFGLLRPIKLERIKINAEGCNRFYWRCQCDCGKQCIKTATYLLYYDAIVKEQLSSGRRKRKLIQSCGCEAKRITRWAKLDIDPRHFSRIKQSAKARNLEFNITPEYINELFYKQNKKSALTGVSLILPKYRDHATGLSNNPSENDDYIASLDRIDSNKGYTEDNVWWIGRRENICKSNLTIEDLHNFLKNGCEYLEISMTLMKEIQTGRMRYEEE
jgi:hypothetical protein